MSAPGFERSVDRWRPAYRLYQWAWAGLDWLFPPRCGGCGVRGARWCADCQSKTRTIPPPVCQKCGQPLGPSQQDLCPRCLSSPPRYTALRTWAEYGGPLRNAIHRLKYQGDVAMGEVLARPMIDLFRDLNWAVDFVAPVPAGIARRAERGYNQANLLAWPLALSYGIDYRPQALQKVRETRSQVGLTAAERRKNVADAFQASSRLSLSKRVLVIDDVTTSGATIEACAAALLEAGARQVYGLTLGRATFSSHQ